MEINRYPFDLWTLVHFATGILTGLMGFKLRTVVLGGIIYEALEPGFDWEVFGREWAEKDYPPETIGNQVVDVAILAVGWSLGRLLTPFVTRS